MIDFKPFIDQNGLIKPQAAWTDSGNGVFYTSLVQILCKDTISVADNFTFNLAVNDCIGSVLMRTPKNTYGQESWDDYLGVAVAGLATGMTTIARKLLWRYIYHFGFMWNTSSLSDLPKSWLARFPVIWIIMFAAAFPKLSFLSKYSLMVYFKLFTPTAMSAQDKSGTQLMFLQLYALTVLNPSSTLLKTWSNGNLATVMAGYYSPDHPIQEGFKNF